MYIFLAVLYTVQAGWNTYSFTCQSHDIHRSQTSWGATLYTFFLSSKNVSCCSLLKMKTVPFEGKIIPVEMACIRFFFLEGEVNQHFRGSFKCMNKIFYLWNEERSSDSPIVFFLLKHRFHFTFISYLRLNLCRLFFTRVKIRVFAENKNLKSQNCHQGSTVLTQLTEK